MLKCENQAVEEKVELRDLARIAVLYGADQVEDIQFFDRGNSLVAQISVSYKSNGFKERSYEVGEHEQFKGVEVVMSPQGNLSYFRPIFFCL